MKPTVLMIDDDTALLRLVDMSLTKEGYYFVSAKHGIAGVQALDRVQPAVVLLDISMPKLDGWETCRLIREVSDVPIIMLTGLCWPLSPPATDRGCSGQRCNGCLAGKDGARRPMCMVMQRRNVAVGSPTRVAGGRAPPLSLTSSLQARRACLL